MDDQARQDRIKQFVAAINGRDMDTFDAVYHDDVVTQWPQSGEVDRSRSCRQ